MSAEIAIINKRQDKIDEVIEKLTVISSDLNKIVAVHEHRLLEHDRMITSIEDVMERRREEADVKIQNIYDRFKEEDRILLDEISKLRVESNVQHEKTSQQHEKLSNKITQIEKTIWTYLGGFSVVVFLITYGPSFLKIVK